MTNLSPAIPPIIAPPRRRRWRMVLMVLTIFFAGIVSGAALTVTVVLHRLQDDIRNPQHVAPRLTNWLRRRLDLTPEQQNQVQAVIVQRQAALGDIRHKVEPDIDRELAMLRLQIGQVLTPAQQQKWFQLFDQIRNGWIPIAPHNEPTTSE